MTSKLTLAEQSFENFIPLVKSCYPDGKLDKVYAQKLIDAYQSINISDDIVILLYDNKTASPFFLSSNIEQLFGYTAESLLKWSSLFLFKGIHPSHYSFAYSTFKQEMDFNKALPKERWGHNRIYCSGLKIMDHSRNLRRLFFKGKQLQTDATGISQISVYFAEEIGHLIKSDNYWFRLENGPSTYAYIQQKGKRSFTDLLSKREKEIGKLLLQKKSSQEIADELFLSKMTVETHRKNMIKRTGAINSTAMMHLCKMSNIF